MNPLMSVRMLWSSRAGWDALSRTHPSSFRSFVLIVLPLSLLASAMILYAAWFHAGSYGTQAPFSYWQAVALTFLLTCWLSVHAMAQFIRVAVHTRTRPAYADCYRLAAIAPIPIWLSSLSLLVPSPLFNVVAAVLGLLASGGLIFHGLDALFEHDDSVRTEALAHTVFAVGALVWTLIVAFLAMPFF